MPYCSSASPASNPRTSQTAGCQPLIWKNCSDCPEHLIQNTTVNDLFMNHFFPLCCFKEKQCWLCSRSIFFHSVGSHNRTMIALLEINELILLLETELACWLRCRGTPGWCFIKNGWGSPSFFPILLHCIFDHILLYKTRCPNCYSWNMNLIWWQTLII